MRTPLMVGIVLLSLFWTFAIPLYVPASPIGSVLCVALGAICLWRAAARSPGEDWQPSRRTTTLLLIMLAVAAFGLPTPYWVGPALAMAGLLGILAYEDQHKRLRPLWRGLALAGFVLTAEGLVVPLYISLAAGEHHLPGLRWVLWGLLRLTGHDAAVGPQNVYVPTMRTLHGFPVTTERLALLPLAAIYVGFLLAVTAAPAMRRAARRLAFLALLIAFVYAMVRYALLVALYIYLMHRMGYQDETNRVDVFWNPWWTAVSLLPLAWCLSALASRGNKLDWVENVLGRPPRSSRSFWPAIACTTMATIAFVAHSTLAEPARQKPGRVLVDEFHSDWEKTTRPFDTTWYGQESGYNFYCLYDYISRHFRAGRIEERITSEVLETCDVLIVKIPTKSYGDDEIDAIIKFVRKGGGLFLIGEHTNVFGSGEFINEIAQRFGFKFRYDCLFDTSRKFEQVYQSPRFLPHPVTQNFPSFFFQVSASIKPRPFLGDQVMIGRRLKALSIDYHAQNFYPQVVDQSDMDFGPFVEAWARHVGRGRVLAFGDSTCLSNFCSFQPGKPEFFLGGVHWLNHRNRWGHWKTVWLILGVAALFGGLVLIVNSIAGIRMVFVSIAIVAGVLPLAAGAVRWINAGAYSLPPPRAPVDRVVFEQDHCDYALPIDGFVRENQRAYDLFYQWVMRIGCFPFVGNSVKDCTKDADVVALIRPVDSFTEAEIEDLRGFVENGGGLLVLESGSRTGSATGPLLQRFGLAIDQRSQAYAGLVQSSSGTTFTVQSARVIEGGKPLAWGLGGQTLAVVEAVGKGRIVLAAFAERFTDQQMGGGWGVKPTPDLLRVYDMEFEMLREALGARASLPGAWPPAGYEEPLPGADESSTPTAAVAPATTATLPGDRPTTATP